MNQIFTFENGLSLNLNKNDFTAKITNSIKVSGNLYVPRSVIHESQEYILISIEDGAFRENKTIKSIKFAENSEIQSIGKEAFSNSSIEQITIPSYCNELKEGCFIDALQLNQVFLSPENKHFIYADPEHKIISNISSDKNKEQINRLIFSCHNIIKAIIPPTIKEIGPFSFYRCNKLKTVEFTNDSKLCLIDKCAFLSSSLENIVIPNTVSQIKEYAFSECEHLRTLSLEKNENLSEIGQCAFSNTSLVNISIPTNVKSIGECTFSMCQALKSVEFLGEDLNCEKFCFYLCRNLILMSFPNTKIVPVKINAHDRVSIDFSLFISPGSEMIKDKNTD